MATYAEMYAIRLTGADLHSKIIAAAQEYATTILGEASPSAPRKGWATDVRDDPNKALDIVWAVLIANKAATSAQILAATDATILTAVSNAVNARYGAT
jgi:hypothetical protein